MGTVLHFLVGVAVVGGLLWLVSKAASRYGARTGPTRGRDDALRVVARRQVAKGSSIVRVSVEDRDLLLGASQRGVELLCELPKTADQEAELPRLAGTARSAGNSFAETGWQPRPSFAEALTRSLGARPSILGRRRS